MDYVIGWWSDRAKWRAEGFRVVKVYRMTHGMHGLTAVYVRKGP